MFAVQSSARSKNTRLAFLILINRLLFAPAFDSEKFRAESTSERRGVEIHFLPIFNYSRYIRVVTYSLVQSPKERNSCSRRSIEFQRFPGSLRRQVRALCTALQLCTRSFSLSLSRYFMYVCARIYEMLGCGHRKVLTARGSFDTRSTPGSERASRKTTLLDDFSRYRSRCEWNRRTGKFPLTPWGPARFRIRFDAVI